ncbi:MAG: disulfide bond formation protein DsbB [Alphaproteobacteria bacterium]|jgi:disulfide bond formation protein DsbB
MLFISRLIKNLKPITVVFLVLFLGASLTASSYFIEHVLNEQPCPMCLWQRYSHMVLWAWALLVLLIWPALKNPKVFIFVFVLIGLYSASIGLYQGSGQQGWVELPQSCTGGNIQLADADNLLLSLTNSQKVPNCADIDFEVFGLTLAWWNFIIMSVMLVCLTTWLSVRRVYKRR